ncbi:MAG TPA: hypothetical protein VGJ58_09860 [Gaiellaceae bacterium]
MGDRAAQVIFGVENQEGRRDVLGVRRRRDLEVDVRRLEPVCADLALERPADVGRAALEHEVVARALGARGAKAIAVADDPRGHVTAVGAAEDAETVRIAEVESLQRLVHHRHQILEVDRPPARSLGDRPADRPPPLLAVPGGASWVGVEDDVAGAGEDLELVEEPIPVLAEGAAVDVQQHRIAAAGLEAERPNHPCLDLRSVR